MPGRGGTASALQKDWGFAALIEYGGRRILLDTGNNAGIFARNVERLGVDFTRLDPVVADAMWLDAARRHFRGTVVAGQDLLEI